jgi:hypothetical protein
MLEWLAIEGHDIAAPSRLGRRPGFFCRRDERPGGGLHAERFGDLRRHRLELGTDIGRSKKSRPALAASMSRTVGGNGEAEADRTPLRRDSRADADQPPMLISAPPVRVDGGIGWINWNRNADMAAGKRTMPLVVVCPTPKGLPMASTRSPTRARRMPMASTGNGLSE